MRKTVALLVILFGFFLCSCEPKDFHLRTHSLPQPSDSELPPWNTTMNNLLGIRANDPVNRILQMNWYIEEYGDTWSPLMPVKQNLGGIFKRYSFHDGGYEKDYCFDVKPLPPFRFMYEVALNNDDDRKDSSAWETLCGKQAKVFHTIHNEITPQFGSSSSGFCYNNQWFRAIDNCEYITLPSIDVDDTLCTYGAFLSDDIDDDRHACRPEIHPAQQIWFRDKQIRDHKAYWLFFFQDQSDRFWDMGDLYFEGCQPRYSPADCIVPDDLQEVNRPLVRSPLYGQYQIAFQIKPVSLPVPFSLLPSPLTIDLQVIEKREVVTRQFPEMCADADDRFSHSLKIGDQEMIRVNEPQSNDTDLGIQFVEIQKWPDGRYTGFVQISMVIGDGDDDTGDDNPDGNGAGYIVLHADIFPPADPDQVLAKPETKKSQE